MAEDGGGTAINAVDGTTGPGGGQNVFGDVDNGDPYDDFVEISMEGGEATMSLVAQSEGEASVESSSTAAAAAATTVGEVEDALEMTSLRDHSVHEEENSALVSSVGSAGEKKRSLTGSDDGSLERRVPVAGDQETEEATRVRKEQGVVREHSNEDVHHPNWARHRKHVFVLSEAGKPIYSRYGNEDKLATIMGVMQALVSFVADEKDALRCMLAGRHKFVFAVKHHMIFCAVARSGESPQQLSAQLNYACAQILSVLTLSQLNRIFSQRINYDLRRLLSGTEKFIDNLLNLMDSDPSFLLSAVRCLPLAGSVRDTIGHILQQARVPDLVFAVLVADNQLVTLLRPKRYSLHPLDLHLIFNLVDASAAFHTGESWMPICLPRFDNTGYLHAHVSYLTETDDESESATCLLLLSTMREAFFTLSQCRAAIQEKMRRHSCIRAINEAVGKRATYRIAQTDITDLLHFVYKSKITHQYTSPRLEAPYLAEVDRERLFSLYQYLHHRMHSQARPLKIIYHVGRQEAMLGWVTSGFELYATFSPLVTKPVAISALNKLLRWIKHEEDRLFIFNPQTY